MNNKESLVFLFDIDRTLIDTDQLKISFVAAIQKVLDQSEIHHITAKDLLSQYENKSSKQPSEISFTKFESEEFLKFIADKINLDAEREKEIELGNLRGSFYNYKIFKKALFVETIKFLETAKEKYPHAILGIFSEGTEWQMRKIKLSTLNQYLTKNKNYILISENKLSDEFHKRLANMPDNTVVIDDRLDILKKIAIKHKKLILVHIDRTISSKDKNNKNRKNKKTITTINNLKDLLELEQLKHLSTLISKPPQSL